MAAAERKGHRALEEGDPEAAIGFFEEALAADPCDLELHFQLALLYARRERRRRGEGSRRALEHLEAIVRACDAGREYAGLDRVCFALGRLYGEEPGRRAEAVRIYRRGLEVNPLSALGHNSLGALLMQSGQVLGALGEFKVAIQLDPAFQSSYTNLSRLLFEQVKPEEMAQEFAHILEEFGARAPEVLARLALELVERGREQVYRGLYTKGHQLKNLMGILGSRLRGLRRRARGAGPWEGELAALAAEQERFYEEWVGYLDSMRPEQIHPVVLDPARVARRVVEALQTRAGRARLRLRVQEGVPRLEADERLLREALTNLCLNALEAVGGGEVVVGVGYDPERSVVFVEVEDEGPGIAPEHFEHIFDPGFTTKEGGNGYGLSIARRIARAHQGALRAKSRVGHGTVFRLDLPVNLDAGEVGGAPGGIAFNDWI